MTKLLQTLVDGLAVGSLYALIALGYTMVYGTLQFINFAHSDIFMLGAWVSFLLARAMGWTGPDVDIPLWAGPFVLVGAMTVCGALGFAIERLAYRPLRSAPRLNVLITAIGIALLLENVGQLRWVFGTQPERMPTLLPADTLFTVANVNIQLVDVLVVANAVVLMAALDWLVFRTKMGRAMRAVSFSPKVAALMGILSSPSQVGMPVPAVIGLVLLAGAAAGAINGLLVAVARVPSIIATLGMLTILRGVTEYAMGGEFISDLPDALGQLTHRARTEHELRGRSRREWLNHCPAPRPPGRLAGRAAGRGTRRDSPRAAAPIARGWWDTARCSIARCWCSSSNRWSSRDPR